MTPPAVLPKIEYASTLADIVAQETRDGRLIVRFLVSAVDGELPHFKPCHRLSAAKELRQRGFDCLPDDAEATGSCQAAEPEPDPAEIEAQRRRPEDIKFSLHSPVYYQTNPYPCVCEDRLHDCKGNVLDDAQRKQAAREGPGNQFFIDEPDLMDDFLARYAEYLTCWNAENSHNPIDINASSGPMPTGSSISTRSVAPGPNARLYPVAHQRFHSRKKRMTAAQPVSIVMRYSRVNHGWSQKGSRRSRAHWVSGAPPAQIHRRNFAMSDIWVAACLVFARPRVSATGST